MRRMRKNYQHQWKEVAPESGTTMEVQYQEDASQTMQYQIELEPRGSSMRKRHFYIQTSITEGELHQRRKNHKMRLQMRQCPHQCANSV